MHLKISAPDKTIFDGKIKKVTLPTEEGEITVLPGHQPLSSVVKP
jgi:F0F1-type ATP synthase epsilon subunit